VCFRNVNKQPLLTRLIGRTGRFGRKGISINFVHDNSTWAQMESIEKATGKSIIRIETTDLDIMEEVRFTNFLHRVHSREHVMYSK
jgi:superfamily II DNA/RNA helicase